MIHPVFQMILEPSGSRFGLKFSQESDDFSTPVFVIPLYQNAWHYADEYYMPGEISGRPINFKLANDEFGRLVLKDERLNFHIFFDGRFAGDSDLRDYHFNYIGEFKEFLGPYQTFQIIVPLDLLVMDQLFLEQRACFVGLTPTFGERIIQVDTRT
jgi:hypothetical protein